MSCSVPNKKVSYSTIVLYSRDHKGVGVTHKKTSPKKPASTFLTTMRQYWLSPNKLSDRPEMQLLWNFLPIDCLTDRCPQTNITRKWLRLQGLIFSLFNVALAREVPFGILQYVQYFIHGLISILLYIPFILADSERCRFGGSTQWLPFIMQIILFFIVRSYFDYRGAFQTVLDS